MFEIEDSLGEESLRQENLYKYEIVEDGTGWRRRTPQCNLEEQFCLSRNGTLRGSTGTVRSYIWVLTEARLS